MRGNSTSVLRVFILNVTVAFEMMSPMCVVILHNCIFEFLKGQPMVYMTSPLSIFVRNFLLSKFVGILSCLVV